MENIMKLGFAIYTCSVGVVTLYVLRRYWLEVSTYAHRVNMARKLGKAFKTTYPIKIKMGAVVANIMQDILFALMPLLNTATAIFILKNEAR